MSGVGSMVKENRLSNLGMGENFGAGAWAGGGSFCAMAFLDFRANAWLATFALVFTAPTTMEHVSQCLLALCAFSAGVFLRQPFFE